MDTESYKIVWTKNAVSDYNRIINYLLENWSDKIITDFNKNVQAKLKTLSRNKHMGVPSSKIKGVRSILLTKHNRLYYRVRKNLIELLNIIDTRQNPVKNPY